MEIAIGLSILTAFLWAITNILDKLIVSRYLLDIKLLYIPLSLINVFAGAIVLAFFWQPLETPHYFLAILSGIALIIMGYLYFLAAKIEDISRVAPLFAIVPITTAMLGAIFLGEIFSVKIYISMGLIVFGSMLIMFRGNLPRLFRSRAFGLMILSSVVVSFNAIITKYLLEFYSFWVVFGWTTLITGVIGMGIFMKWWRKLVEEVHQRGYKGIWITLSSEAISIGATIIYTLAVSLWYVSLVSSIITLQYAFVFIFSVILYRFRPGLLGEEVSKKIAIQKVIALLLIISGIFLIA